MTKSQKKKKKFSLISLFSSKSELVRWRWWWKNVLYIEKQLNNAYHLRVRLLFCTLYELQQNGEICRTKSTWANDWWWDMCEIFNLEKAKKAAAQYLLSLIKKYCPHIPHSYTLTHARISYYHGKCDKGKFKYIYACRFEAFFCVYIADLLLLVLLIRHLVEKSSDKIIFPAKGVKSSSYKFILLLIFLSRKLTP